jgi:DNA uptake protein ComE-like DNA-binding protein
LNVVARRRQPDAKPADLDRVPGIGAATLRELTPLLDFPRATAKPPSR